MRIGFLQLRPKFGAIKKNVRKAVSLLDRVSDATIVLPELFNTGYQFISREEAAELAEEIPAGKTCKALMELARSGDMYLVFGLAERDNNKIFNSAVLIGPEGYIGRYRKTHLFAEEKRWFRPGSEKFQVYDT